MALGFLEDVNVYAVASLNRFTSLRAEFTVDTLLARRLELSSRQSLIVINYAVLVYLGSS
jgi:hypothetical protein